MFNLYPSEMWLKCTYFHKLLKSEVHGNCTNCYYTNLVFSDSTLCSTCLRDKIIYVSQKNACY